MAKASDVLNMLCPGIEWTISGDEYENIIWHSGQAAITKKQFEKGFVEFDAWKAKQDADKVIAKNALLAKLGITAEEAQILLS